jgi:hypothetical protein
MDLPDRFGGFCQKDTGIVVTRDANCVACQKLNASGLENCDELASQGIKPRLPPAMYEIEARLAPQSPQLSAQPFLLASNIAPRQEFCNRSQDHAPACIIATGMPLNMTGCEAGMQGMKYTMPCMYLEGLTTVPYFDGDAPLVTEESPKFIGKVSRTMMQA